MEVTLPTEAILEQPVDTTETPTTVFESLVPELPLTHELLLGMGFALEAVEQLAVGDLEIIADATRQHLIEQLIPEEICFQIERQLSARNEQQYADLQDTP